MNTPKPNRRKAGTQKLEPIDWHEYANDAVLQGNMSTLYQRPASEDPTAYASPEALLEIKKRVPRQLPAAVPNPTPTVGTETTGGTEPTVGAAPTVGIEPSVGLRDKGAAPADAPIGNVALGHAPTVGLKSTAGRIAHRSQEPTARPIATAGLMPSVAAKPPVVSIPTVGTANKKKVKPIRDLQDALTLAGQVLYRAMYGVTGNTGSRSCTKGYRQLAAETRLDKDTVRDLISEFKEKGILRETGTYDPDTRLSKTYEIFSEETILGTWQTAGVFFVTAGRQRPAFCTATGVPVGIKPTVG